MEDLKAEETHKPVVHEATHEVEGVVQEVGKDGAATTAVDEQRFEHKPSAKPTAEDIAADQVDPSADKIIKPVSEGQPQDISVDVGKESAKNNVENKTAVNQDEAPTKNGVSSSSKPSKRVQEGQKWNDRDREKQDYSKNIKSDLTSQEESSDPVAIRKQVGLLLSYFGFIALIKRTASLNSISPTPTFLSTNFSSLKLKDMTICRSHLVLSIHSSACVTSSP